MTRIHLHSPIGGLGVYSDGEVVTAIRFDAEPSTDDRADDVLDAARQQLEEYFAGDRTSFDLPLASRGTTFQRAVWAELVKVPYGATASYGDITTRLDLPMTAARAVGSANGANPLPIVVPCHRVIGANGSLTGYAGGIERKRVLLELETPGLF